MARPGQTDHFAYSHDGNASACTWAYKIVWEADYTGWVYVRVYPFPWSHGGYGTYDLTVTAPTPGSGPGARRQRRRYRRWLNGHNASRSP